MHVNERDEVASAVQQQKRQNLDVLVRKTRLGLQHTVTDYVYLYQNILGTGS
jgi:hypothetical protein